MGNWLRTWAGASLTFRRIAALLVVVGLAVIVPRAALASGMFDSSPATGHHVALVAPSATPTTSATEASGASGTTPSSTAPPTSSPTTTSTGPAPAGVSSQPKAAAASPTTTSAPSPAPSAPAPAPAAAAQPAAPAPSAVSISNPAANIAPNPAYFAESTTSPCWQVTNGVFVPAPSTPQCIAAEVQATDAARADEGIGPIQLPSNFATLTQPEQLFVLADLERVSRGLAPIVGLSATLSASAQSAAAAGADPTLGAGVTGYSWWGSTWAGGVLNALDANYTWMYQDGWGGSGPTYNLACTSPTAPGCWGHRDIILTTTPGTLVMGAGYAPDSGFASLTELIVAFQATATPPLSYTWSEAEAAGAAA